jgi:plasmid stability protein
MASLTVRNIDKSLKEHLRISAAANGRSMEEEVRQILKKYLLGEKSSVGIASKIHRRFAAVGGIDLPEVPRSLPRQPLENALDKVQ